MLPNGYWEYINIIIISIDCKIIIPINYINNLLRGSRDEGEYLFGLKSTGRCLQYGSCIDTIEKEEKLISLHRLHEYWMLWDNHLGYILDF